jgi:hypothetical protein
MEDPFLMVRLVLAVRILAEFIHADKNAGNVSEEELTVSR